MDATNNRIPDNFFSRKEVEGYLSDRILKDAAGKGKVKKIKENLEQSIIVKFFRIIEFFNTGDWINNKNSLKRLDREISDITELVKKDDSTLENLSEENYSKIIRAIAEWREVCGLIKNKGGKRALISKIEEKLKDLDREIHLQHHDYEYMIKLYLSDIKAAWQQSHEHAEINHLIPENLESVNNPKDLILLAQEILKICNLDQIFSNEKLATFEKTLKEFSFVIAGSELLIKSDLADLAKRLQGDAVLIVQIFGELSPEIEELIKKNVSEIDHPVELLLHAHQVIEVIEEGQRLLLQRGLKIPSLEPTFAQFKELVEQTSRTVQTSLKKFLI